MSDFRKLAASSLGSVVAAAGCGKTELIVRAVESHSDGHQLILTHTNAGVHALRQRLIQRRVPQERFSVDTLDGWCLRFVKAYPSRSRVAVESSSGEINWKALRQGMLSLLKLDFIRRIIRASYTGVFVDEYQDCNLIQHAIVAELGKLLPTRVLGDPMQAIFGFSGNVLVDWSTVTQHFPAVLELNTPQRWMRPGANGELGKWLAKVRPILGKRSPVPLNGSPVDWIGIGDANIMDAAADAAIACARECSDGERLVVLWKWRPSCHDMAMRTGGFFQCVEPIDSKEGRDALLTIMNVQGQKRVEAVLDFAGICCTHIGQDLRKSLLRWVQGLGRGSKTPEIVDLVERLKMVLTGDWESVAKALLAIYRLPEVRTYRKELFHTVVSSLEDVTNGAAECPLAAFAKRRQATSRSGRRLAFRSAGTPLLLKGLEFEHVLVINEGRMGVRELYVALTRATRRLTIVSPTPELVPSGW